MNVQIDTNILTRSAEPGHPLYQPARLAVAALRSHGHGVCLVPQNLYEFWVVATRPTTANGLGKSAAEAAAEVASLRAFFTFLPDVPTVYAEWERLVTAHAVLGKPAHDARFAAAMQVHGLTHLLTFNDADFRRYPGLTVLTPAQALAAYPLPGP